METIFSDTYNNFRTQVSDLSKFSLDELKFLLKRAKEIEEEYNNLQLVVKRNSNSIYGVSANIFYSLCDVDIAEDITMGAKHFTVIVDKALNNFFVNWGEEELKIIQQFYPDVTSLRKFTEYVPDTINDYCVYGDTDSRYCDDELLYKLMGKELPTDDKELSDFIVFLNKNFFEKIIKETIDKECEFRGARKGYLKMNHEVTVRKSSFIKKKKYILTKIWENGKFLGKRKFKFQGIEIKRGSMSKRMKKILEKLVEKFMIDDYSMEQMRMEVLKLIAYIKNRKEKDLIYLITSVSNLSNITQKENGEYVSSANHIQMQIAVSWLNFTHENNMIDYKPPFEGQKMNYYYCAEGQKYKVIGIPDDVNINSIKNLPEPDWNIMLTKLLVKPLLRYIHENSEIDDKDCENFLLGIKGYKF